MTDRATLALPIDVARGNFDFQVTQTQLSNNTFLGSADDRDVLFGLVEDAEDEFRRRADLNTRVSRVGIPGNPETYEQWTYQVKGHEAFKQSWARTSRDYRPTEAERNLNNDRVMPFDSSNGDEVRVYRGMRGTTSDTWEDVTDQQGDLWDVVDHQSGTLVLHPVEIHRAMQAHAHGIGGGGQLRQVRVAICYRHGGLGRGRSLVRSTELGESITSSDTGSVSVDDSDVIPSGVAGAPPILKVGDEYIRATPDRSTDTIDVAERGVRGTSADSHDSGDRVVYVPPAVRTTVSARAAMKLLLGERYNAYLPDADDAIDIGEMLDELRATWESTLSAVGGDAGE
jgi:hypothetical protein